MNETIVNISHLKKNFGKQHVLNDVSINIHKGDIYGFLGSNGAGKSTTMKLMLGLIKANSGEISIFNHSIVNNRDIILKNVGALIENPSFYPNLTGWENLYIIKRLLNLPNKNIYKVLKIVDLIKDKNKLVKNYSLGMKQRLGIAMAIIKFPKLLILDEPTNGLDPEGMYKMRKVIKKLSKNYGITILISSHILSEMEQTVNTVGILNNGRIIYQGSIDKIKQNKKYLLKTDNVKLTKHILIKNNCTNVFTKNNITMFNIKNRNIIPKIIKILVKNNVNIYLLNNKRKSLEDLFLDLMRRDKN